MYSFINPIEKRVLTNVDHQWQITDFGADNLYPQRMEELYKRSPLTKSAIAILTEFISGEGFGNTDPINRYGQTWDTILRSSANEFSTFNGFALHLNFSATGALLEVQQLPFEFVRLGIRNQDGITDYCMVSANWEEDSEKHADYVGPKPVKYKLFNPMTAASETLMGGNGQVLYYTPRMFTYPLCSFDAVRDSVQTDHEIQSYMLSKTSSGFLGTTIFKYPGGFDSEADRRATVAKVQGLKGAEGARFIVAETPEDFTGNLIEAIPAPNDDKLFDLTELRVRDKILQNYAIPGALMGVAPEGAVFTSQEIKDSYDYVNARTKHKRLLMESIFQPLAALAGVTLGPIKKQEFEITGLNQDRQQVNQGPQPVEDTEEEPTEEEAKLRKIYG